MRGGRGGGSTGTGRGGSSATATGLGGAAVWQAAKGKPNAAADTKRPRARRRVTPGNVMDTFRKLLILKGFLRRVASIFHSYINK
jgi:hypothetical protein